MHAVEPLVLAFFAASARHGRAALDISFRQVGLLLHDPLISGDGFTLQCAVQVLLDGVQLWILRLLSGF